MAWVTRTRPSGNADLDAMLTGYHWASPIVYYSFPKTGSGFTGYGDVGLREPETGFRALNTAQQDAITRIFWLGLTFIDITFAESSAGSESSGDIRIGMTNDTDAAHAYLPSPKVEGAEYGEADPVAGDVWFNNSSHDYDAPKVGDYAYYTFLHEIGHALGLNHPHDGEYYGTVSLPRDNLNYTVMSYRSYEGMGIEAPYNNEDYGFPQTYMMLDIAALQQMYGANYRANSEDTVYSWDPATGAMRENGSARVSPAANKVFMTVWDGGGVDTYDLSLYTGTVTIDLDPGAWTRTSPGQLVDLGDGHSAIGNIANAWLYKGDTRSLIENAVGGSAGDTMRGNVGSNRLSGGAGDDVLDGRAGGDTLVGGTGNDIYFVDDAADMVVEADGEGVDHVNSSAARFTVGAFVETLTAIGTGEQILTGNAQGNVITGNMVAANTLDGGGGADRLVGGSFNDSYGIDDDGDQIADSGGIDTVLASVSYTLAADMERLTLTGTAAVNGTGNAHDNILKGNAAANVLDGGAGADVLEGGAGDDTYLVDAADSVVEAAGGGTDRVIAAFDYKLGANLENLTLIGNAVAGEGNALANEIVGNAGANRLDGGAGADRMVGGGGDDSYLVDNSADVIVEEAGGGADSVVASASFVLGAHVETLQLSGAADLNGTGNASANLIVGTAGNNILDGGAGADRLYGGAGNDTLVVDDLGDVVFGEDGTDTVMASVGYVLGDGVENLTLTGTAAIDATGNALANFLVGNAGNNRLDGGAGADTMWGGAGDDVYVVRDLGEQIFERFGEGIDTVLFVAEGFFGTIQDNIENIILSGNQNVTGNALGNTITAFAGGQTLDGGFGADRMIGGTGSDYYIVDNAGDVVEEVANALDGSTVRDWVLSSVSYSLGDNLEDLTLTGSALSATGNALDNTIQGNEGDNRIEGGAGADILFGHGGRNTFVFWSFADSLEGSPDRIWDFKTGNDKIDLTGLGRITVSITTVGGASFGYQMLTANSTLGLGTLVLRVDGSVSSNDLIMDGPTATAGNDTLVGSEAADELRGEGGDDILMGMGGDDSLLGGDGKDRLDGGTGYDRMIGGAGDDVYVVGDTRDVVTEDSGGGVDTIESTIDLVLPDNVENLV
ncbi:MAG TPA: M10 family metallopeptidase C-terminal domain-containing protein, partial [Allosphingosinicella sp.]